MVNVSNFIQKLQTSSDNIYLVKGSVGGLDTWYYLLVDKMKLPIFERLVSQNAEMDLKDYGKIIKSGYGSGPAPYIVEKVKREGASYDESEFAEPFREFDLPYFIMGWDAERNLMHHYVMVPASVTNEFLVVMNNGGCDMSSYGTIVESGWGEPDEETKQRMREMGFKHPEDEVV